MSDSVCMLWIRSMHSCGMVHQAMASLTNHTHSTSDQHEELGKSRASHDQNDFEKVANWINEMDPFDVNRVQLQSLTSGLTANENVNCDEAESVGQKIQSKLDDQIFSRCSVKRSDQVTTLASMKNVVKVNKQSLNIDPSKLFSRLLVCSERNGDISSHFEYELTPVPASLFIDNFMRKANKAQLIHHLFGKDFQIVVKDKIIKTDIHVIDGGALLRQIKWNEKSSFEAILDSYSSFINSKYGKSTIVFDGYGVLPSTKDHEHSRRGSLLSPDFKIREETILTVSQQSFLTNSKNKNGLLKLLIPRLLSDGHTVKQAEADADTMIVQTVLQAARDGKSVTVFANDTDVIVMLLYHWNSSLASILV